MFMKKDYDVFGLLEFLKKLGYACVQDDNSDVWSAEAKNSFVAFGIYSERNKKWGVHDNLNGKIVVDPVLTKCHKYRLR